MATIKGPLFSKTASGRIFDSFVFSLRASGQQARFQRGQKDIITSARVSQRAIYSEAVSAWNILSASEKLEWKIQAKKLHFTGYNLFMRFYINSYSPDLVEAYFGIAIFGNSIYGGI